MTGMISKKLHVDEYLADKERFDRDLENGEYMELVVYMDDLFEIDGVFCTSKEYYYA